MDNTVIDTPAVNEEVELIRKLAKEEMAQHLEYQRQDIPSPHAAYYRALDALFLNYSPTALPFARNSMKRWRDLYEEWERGSTNIHRQEFWGARMQALEDIFKEKPACPAWQTPAEMRAIGANYVTIAHEWLIYQDDGKTPDIDRVMQELAEPGSVLTPEFIEWRKQKHYETIGWIIPEADIDKVKAAFSPHSLPKHDPIIGVEEMVRSRMPLEQIFGIMKRRYNLDDQDDFALRNLIMAFADMMNTPLAMNAQEAINIAGHEMIEGAMGKDFANSNLPPVYVMPTGTAYAHEPQVQSTDNSATPIHDTVMQLFSEEKLQASEIAKRTGLSRSEVRRIITQRGQ